MLRVGSLWTAAAIAFALGGCGESRSVAQATGAQSGCASCHSAPDEAPPFRDATGSSAPADPQVGAHDAHLSPGFTQPISCSECHAVPRSIDDPGHLEDLGTADVRFGPLATTGGVAAAYTRPDCSATYCHGNFPGGRRTNAPDWVGDATQGTCSACHGFALNTFPGDSPTDDLRRHEFHVNVQGLSCAECHGPLLSTERHVNGVKDINQEVVRWNPATRLCMASCHAAEDQGGSRLWPALP